MKLSSSRVFLILYIFLICPFFMRVQAQSMKQQDSAYLSHPFKEKVQQIKKSIAKTFVNFKGNDLSLYGALSLNHQNINDKSINSYHTQQKNTLEVHKTKETHKRSLSN